MKAQHALATGALERGRTHSARGLTTGAAAQRGHYDKRAKPTDFVRGP